jgi:hypothetical protein
MYKIKESLRLSILFFVLFSSLVFSQKNFQAATVAFYNVENLFDTIVSVDYVDGTRSPEDPLYHISIPKADIPKYDTVYYSGEYLYEKLEGKKVIRRLILQEDEFSPKGKKVWNYDRYQRKLHQLSVVIKDIGREDTGTAPVIVGLSEVETYQTVEDLANHPLLKPYNYGAIHFNSFDARGIDLGLLYQKDRFQVTLAKPYPIILRNPDTGRRIYTRDILRVTGLLDGEEITFLVNHWPSRSGGEKKSRPNRIEAAKVMKAIFDEIRAEDPKAKIIAMGDYNDDPVNVSIKEEMGTVGKKENVKDSDIYNPMESIYKKRGDGTLAYRDAWNLFDQFLVTGTLVEKNKKFDTYKMFKTEIYSPAYIRTPEGPYKGFPYRMFGGDTFYPDGYSDHFPIYTVLLREMK